MLVPENVQIYGMTGGLSPCTGRHIKRVSDIGPAFADPDAVDRARAAGDPVVYEVAEYRRPGSDLFFGTTTMFPGTVGGEFHMTRGHFHVRRDMGEMYYTQAGRGVLLLQSRDGETRELDMHPGTCAFIPPDWAHRSVNVGADALVFVWCCNQEAGQDYEALHNTGMRKRVMQRGQTHEIVAA